MRILFSVQTEEAPLLDVTWDRYKYLMCFNMFLLRHIEQACWRKGEQYILNYLTTFGSLHKLLKVFDMFSGYFKISEVQMLKQAKVT